MTTLAYIISYPYTLFSVLCLSVIILQKTTFDKKGWIVRIFEKLHICSFSKPIVSRYISFNTRSIVYECRCGERKIKRVYCSFDSPFPIETTIFISNKEIQKIADKKAKPKTFNRVGKI